MNEPKQPYRTPELRELGTLDSGALGYGSALFRLGGELAHAVRCIARDDEHELGKDLSEPEARGLLKLADWLELKAER